MDALDQKIQTLLQTPHCSNCGALNPEFTPYGEHTKEGHTACCNDAICHHIDEYTFGNEDVTCQACCWAVAELKFRQQGIDILEQPGMRRFE